MTDFNTILVVGDNVDKQELSNALNDLANTGGSVTFDGIVSANSFITNYADPIGATVNGQIWTNSFGLRWKVNDTEFYGSYVGHTHTIGEVSINAPVKLSSYTTAGLPAASGNTGGIVYVTDGGGGGDPALAVSNGTNWLRVTLGATIA